MEVGSHSTIFNHSKCSPPHPGEFEFQMISSSSEKDTTTSPADELFYKGKLLPLHLPPRLEMVEKLLQNPNTNNCKPENLVQNDAFEECFGSPLFTTTNHTPNSNTPFQSCNISPSVSCRVSRELNLDDYFFAYATEEAGSFSLDENSKRSWTRKLKLIKQSSLSSKLKASRAYLRSLIKSSCSSEASAVASRIIRKGCVPQASEDAKVAKEDPFGRVQSSSSLAKSFNKENAPSDERGNHRSFSGASRTVSMTRSSDPSSSSSASSSASSSNNSNGFQELQFFKRGTSSYSEIENSIQAAIAHCKRSQHQFQTRKAATDLGFCSLSASRVIYEEQERSELCRG